MVVRLFCAYCMRDRPAFAYMEFANGSRILCDVCWLRSRCRLPWWVAASSGA